MREGTPLTWADMHVHVDFMSNAAEVVADARAGGLALFANTVTPQGFLAARGQAWSAAPNVRLGLGMHPWWVADGRVGEGDVAAFCELAGDARYVGELGLDFSDAHTRADSHERQVRALRAALEVSGRAGGKVISLHAVRSVGTVLDLLEETGCLASCSCVLHWFSGSTPELWRAIRSGCHFSVNERQARTRRAREQLKLVPGGRLLLETDLPPGQGAPSRAAAIEGSLSAAADLLSRIRGADVRATCRQNAARILHILD